MIKNFFARGASVVAIAALAPIAAVYAQETSSEVRGSIVDANGAAVAGATVTITHQPTGTANTLVTNTSGGFFQTGLRVGGPYSIFVSAPGFEGEALNDIRLSPGTQSPLRIRLAAAADDTAVMSTIVVTGQAINILDLNNGVGSNYGARDVANQPSLARDIISTLNRDPLAISSGPNNLSVAGVNPRFNGVTIDGARQQDNFGLGTNTFATTRSPINLDIVESVSLVASDYSVTASGFTGGLVNVTTKGGSNEFDGSLFYYYRDQDYLGTTTFGGSGTFNPGVFEEKEYGVTLRGPIVKDTLFFSLSYDKFETAQQIDFTATDAANGIQPGFFDALNDLVETTYNIDMLGRPTQAALPEEVQRYFARVDWNINSDHRIQANYQKVEENRVSGVSALSLQSAWYDTPNELTTYSAQLFSDWTPNFSTKLRANYVEQVRDQNCRAPADVGELQFILSGNNVVGSPLDGLITSGATTRTITGGCDRFRHINLYSDERLQLQGQADYVVGDFIFTFGGEYETLDLFNAFVERSRGAFIFTGASAGANIGNRIANVQYRNVPSNVAEDGAAAWGYSRATAFGQARWQVLPELEVSGGVRYEVINTDDIPTADPTFLTSVGIPNTTTTDGLDLIMPRIGFRYTPLDKTTLSGGFGLFSGGDPGVWTSNAFQVPAVLSSVNNVTGVDPRVVPAAQLAAVAAGTPLAIDAIDPNFELPSDWKASIRLDQEFDLSNLFGIDLGSGYVASAQLLYSKSKDSFVWQEFAQTNAIPPRTPGIAPDGRPIYADLQALGVSNRTVLANATGDESLVYTLSLANEYDNGFGFYAAYSHQDVEMITEGSSSRGISSYRGQVSADRNFPEPRTSLYQIEDAYKIGLSYERAFVSDLATRIDLFGQVTSGGAFTYTFDIDNNNALFGRAGNGENPFDNNPLYVPLNGDPRVVYGPSFNGAAFTQFVQDRGLEQGKIHEVNSAASTWNQRWDLRIQQDLPGLWGAKNFIGDNRFKLVFDVENFGNLLNDNWGTTYNAPANGQLPVVRADLVRASDVANLGVAAAPALLNDAARTACTTPGACLYRYNSFSTNNSASLQSNSASVWKARVGIRYEF